MLSIFASLFEFLWWKAGSAEVSKKYIDAAILQQNDANFTNILLFGATSFNKNTNSLILMALMDYLVATGRFDQPPFNNC